MLIAKLKKWRADRNRFPVRWLTYKRRVRDDVERILKEEGGLQFFNEEYQTKLADAARELERWELKLLLYQFAISAFVILGFLASDASISLFGISLKHATGLKELLLALSATIAVAIYAVSHSKQLRFTVIEKLTELRVDQKFLPFARVAIPGPFNLVPYVARQFDKWIFPTFLTQMTMVLLAAMCFMLVACLLVLSVILWAYLGIQILRELSLGIWSYVALGYSATAYGVCALCLIRAHCPLPFRDMHDLQEVARLRTEDPAAYEKRVREIYG